MFTTIKEVHDFLQSRSKLGIRLGLSRMEMMLDFFHRPEKRLKVVHLAGTNGKGSTLTFMKQTLLEANYRVGTFTSPSLTSINEQIQLNDQAIDDEHMLEMVNRLIPIIQELDERDDGPTEFEIVVMIAILYFVDKVDIALIETGMGGREDSTNCLTPLLSIITNIGLDHKQFLGDSYEKIAYEKAGIIKKDVPVIVGDVNESSLTVIKNYATSLQAPIFHYQIDYNSSQQQLKEDKTQTFLFTSVNEEIPLTITMLGKHQIKNATIACKALMQLNDLGFPFSITELQKGFQKAMIPGRFEKVCDNPIVYVDGAHNTEGIATFIDTVQSYFPNESKQLLFAAFKDKPLEEMINQMDATFDHIVFTSFEHKRAAGAATLYDLSKHNNKVVESDWKQAITKYVTSNQEHQVHFITGSLAYIGLVRRLFL
ncbi:bifunctional folylpolyglutamate synthase/dihydrofolate synthase [Aquibacillus koreensis]|uniref:tetrahydrofolate synthase n=1 Tax=Aquibacillus koreensis TaxID=279446 RepID=A0A9X4AIA2_9BACI|nr:folylpolyglutamate synthase/dihydrofolate synthase family protein [Aquibacillus koreensis]MCT2537939.1 bifunctional folylpolyglutamate synthase/dihydrofolate synthase [Aquibacillus koreensis]MDC3419170.1 bifunctional folylpolyglutamate synthase/dihydrofolate synthase [Aquibacillus koreensis]